ncbi:MAG: PrsW family glutamic-type intramembrane protease [Bacteroidales bacterium]
MTLLALALAPIFIILFYVYIRDKYEREPIGLLIKAFFSPLTVIPILFIGSFIESFEANFSGLFAAAYRAFIVAAFNEEFFKFIALYLLIWKSSEFDEKFDGIVYAVFISLGFAAVENVMYVYQYGHETE